MVVRLCSGIYIYIFFGGCKCSHIVLVVILSFVLFGHCFAGSQGESNDSRDVEGNKNIEQEVSDVNTVIGNVYCIKFIVLLAAANN